MNKIFIKLVFMLLLLSSPVLAEISFLTPVDQELYTNFSNEVSKQQMKNFKDKVDFYNVTVDKTPFDKILKKQAILYLDQSEFENILRQGPSGFYGMFRLATIYTGIGLVNIGYQTYSQNFNDFKVTFSKSHPNYLIIKPEIIHLNWRYEATGFLKTNLFALVDMVVQITVLDGDKQILQKIYKVNNVEIGLNELHKAKKVRNIGSNSVFPSIAFSKALALIFQKNIQDLSEMLN